MYVVRWRCFGVRGGVGRLCMFFLGEEVVEGVVVVVVWFWGVGCAWVYGGMRRTWRMTRGERKVDFDIDEIFEYD